MSSYMDIDGQGYTIPRVIPFRQNYTRPNNSTNRIVPPPRRPARPFTPVRVVNRPRRRRITTRRKVLSRGGDKLRMYRKARKAYIDRLLKSVGVGTKTPTYNCHTMADVVSNTLNTTNYNLMENDSTLGVGLFNKARFDRIFAQAVVDGLANDVNTKLVVTYQDSVLRLKNQSDIQADVTVYLLKVRKAIPNETTIQGIISTGFNQIGAANSSNQPPSVKLWMNEYFNRYFEIVRKKHWYLDPTAERQISAKSKKVFTKSKLYQSTTSFTELRGAMLWMISVNGSLVHDTTDKNIINVGAVTLDVSVTETTNWYAGSTRSTTVDVTADADTTVAAGEAFVLEDIAESVVENPA